MSSRTPRTATPPPTPHRPSLAAALALAALLAPGAAAATAPAARGAEPPQEETRRRVVLVVDDSASMRQAAVEPRLGEAADRLAAGLEPDDEIGLVVFDGTARLAVPLGPVATQRDLVRAALDGLPRAGARTDIPAGVERALFELRQGEPGDLEAVLVVTDGRIDTGSDTRDAERAGWLRQSLLPEARREGVVVLGLGLGPAADYQLLQEMQAATGGRYERADAPESIARFFAAVPSALDDVERAREAEALQATAAKAEQERRERTERLARATGPGAAAASDSFLPWILAGLALTVALVIALVLLARRRGGGDAAIPAGAETPPAGACLRQVSSGQVLPLEKAVVLVGRDADNDLVIPLMTVTRNHAKIRYREGSFYIEDLRSTNGTYVNGQRLTAETVLCDGDEIRFDKDRYVFERQFDGEKTNVIGEGDRTIMRAPGDPSGPVAAAAVGSWPRPLQPGPLDPRGD